MQFYREKKVENFIYFTDFSMFFKLSIKLKIQNILKFLNETN